MTDAISKAVDALENLFWSSRANMTSSDHLKYRAALTTISEALQAMQGEAEPVAWMVTTDRYGKPHTYPVTGDYDNVVNQCDYGNPVPLYTAPQPALPKWVGGHPPIETMAIMHIPLRGYPDYMVIGYMDEEGWIMDSSGDDAGYNADDVVRWMLAPALNSAGKGE
jgi:hypothetical protein